MNGNAIRVLAIYFLWKKRQQKRRRTVGVDPYNATSSFDELLCKLEFSLRRSSIRRIPIAPVEKLAITLSLTL
ncbi:hypothetical protein HF086_009008 [Spodoptera exigua]|uniref:Uncharacterized protein n=1 Tax=Spodoptera exigua TaxID=7107 RepID=A0A922S9Q9_SPOEX|nr:hypothetical protein HF086_009008 [Spodoptera exigua]